MTNLFNYFILILVLVGLMTWLIGTELMNSWELMGLIFFHSIIYRTYINEKRLVNKNIIKQKDFWNMIILGKRLDYFRELYHKI